MGEATYEDAVRTARSIMREGGDAETFRLAVGVAIKEAPGAEERDFWTKVAAVLADGRTVRTKEN